MRVATGTVCAQPSLQEKREWDSKSPDLEGTLGNFVLFSILSDGKWIKSYWWITGIKRKLQADTNDNKHKKKTVLKRECLCLLKEGCSGLFFEYPLSQLDSGTCKTWCIWQVQLPGLSFGFVKENRQVNNKTTNTLCHVCLHGETDLHNFSGITLKEKWHYSRIITQLCEQTNYSGIKLPLFWNSVFTGEVTPE